MGSNVPPTYELADDLIKHEIKDRLTANIVRTIRPMPLEPDCSAMLLDRTPEPELEHDMPSYILMKPGLVSEDEFHASGLNSDDDDEPAKSCVYSAFVPVLLETPCHNPLATEIFVPQLSTHPDDSDMHLDDTPPLNTYDDDHLAPGMEICQAVIRRISPVRKQTLEWMERLTAAQPSNAHDLLVFKKSSAILLDLIRELQVEGYNSPGAREQVICILEMASCSDNPHINCLWENMGDASQLPEGTRDPLYQLATDDAVLREVGLIRLAGFVFDKMGFQRKCCVHCGGVKKMHKARRFAKAVQQEMHKASTAPSDLMEGKSLLYQTPLGDDADMPPLELDPDSDYAFDGTNLISRPGRCVFWDGDSHFLIQELVLEYKQDARWVTVSKIKSALVERIHGIPREYYKGRCEQSICWEAAMVRGGRPNRDIRQICAICHKNVCVLCVSHMNGLTKCKACDKTICWERTPGKSCCGREVGTNIYCKTCDPIE